MDGGSLVERPRKPAPEEALKSWAKQWSNAKASSKSIGRSCYRLKALRSHLVGGWWSGRSLLDRPKPPYEKDYERLTETGEAFIYVAMSSLMVKRLARS